MRYSVILLVLVTALVAGLALAGPAIDGITSATGGGDGGGRRPDQIQTAAFRRADQVGKLVMFVYANQGASTEESRAKSILTTRTTSSLTNTFILASIPITGDDGRYAAYRDAIESDGPPYWFLVTPEGELVAGGGISTLGNGGNGPWKRTIAEVASSHPPIAPQDRRAIGQALRGGQTALDDGDYEAVARIVPRLRMVWYTAELAEQASALCEAFDAKVEELLSGPAQLIEAGEILQAAQAYAQLVETFSDRTETGQQIQETLDALLEEHPELRGQMDGDAPASTGPASPPPTDEPDQPQTAQAPPVANDEPVSEEAQAKSLLQLARMYQNREMTDKAKAKLQECIEKFPGTEAAATAAELLGQW